MNHRESTLHELICLFEVPPSDTELPVLVAHLGEHAVLRAAAGTSITNDANAQYFYLLARVYELLGYSARHTPWLTSSQRFYWKKVGPFLDEAMLLTPPDSSYYAFLHGKHLLREAMTFTLDSKTADAGDGQTLLGQAEERFEYAASIEPDRTLRAIYRDAASIARTEARLRLFRRELQHRISKASKRPTSASLEGIVAYVSTFPGRESWAFPSSASGMNWPIQDALAEARYLYGKKEIYDDVVVFVADIRRKAENRGFGEEVLNEFEENILAFLESAASICKDAGLIVRAADSRVTLLRRRAEASLRHCIREFKAVQDREQTEGAALIERTAPSPQRLPAELLEALRSVRPDHEPDRVPSALLQGVRDLGLELDEQAKIFAESRTAWLLRSGSDRYLLRKAGDFLELVDLHKQQIPFSHRESETFRTYAMRVNETCELYTLAIHEIHRLLGSAAGWYEQITDKLASDRQAAANDAHLASLHVTTASILQELKGRNYPLLATLRDRRRYAWSLLEMFQMRNQSVRLGTLFSGQCQLVMANPFYQADQDVVDDPFLEVGADPIFQTTVDFLFRGAKGDANRYDFQQRALKTTRITIDQQERSLLIECRFLDLDHRTRHALISRLACHRSLALALEKFTDIFKAQLPGEIKTGTIQRLLVDIRQYFNDAVAALEASGDYPSKLIDGAGLEALHDYMKAIGQVLIGMNERQQHRPWESTYRGALSLFARAKKRLQEAGDVYLLPKGDDGGVRRDYIRYIDARIYTVEGFKAWYHAEEGRAAADYDKAAALFRESAGVFDELHDYRVATKARARAAHARSLATGVDAVRYKHLKEANALYAACADATGYQKTLEMLEEFAQEEVGTSSRKTGSAPPPSGGTVRPSPVVQQQLQKSMIGPYEVLAPIAEGGMAEVFRAAKNGGETVALKRLLAKYADDDEYITRFLREYENAKIVSHANVVDVYERGDDRGVPFFTMEYLDGESLAVQVLARQTFRPLEAIGIVKAVAEALDHAHAKGLVHRDLKPENVMLLKDGRIKVMDFGIAQNPKFSRITKKDEFIGTILYAAPEQLGMHPATPLSDLYSLGLIFYELLTGKSALLAMQRLTEDHPAPSAAVPDIPPSLDAIVLKLLARDPSRRYPTARDFIDALQAFVEANAVTLRL